MDLLQTQHFDLIENRMNHIHSRKFQIVRKTKIELPEINWVYKLESVSVI